MFSDAYKEELLACQTYEKLVELSSLLCGSTSFDANEPTYGFEQPVFLFVGVLAWFAQSLRSGPATYYESTPASRIAAIHDALERLAPIGFAHEYSNGAAAWTSNSALTETDKWLEQNETNANVWLSSVVSANRAAFERLLA
jgi:hypothetical protein